MTKVFEILKKLETNQHPDEQQPVGGYGAGVAVMLSDGNVLADKVGKTDGSPVAQLSESVKRSFKQLKDAQVLLGHVRFPSEQYMGSVKFKEGAQPFVEHFEQQLTIVSVHNGNVENFKELKAQLKTHVFESEKVGFVDSEVIPHYFGEMLNELESTDAAVYNLLSVLKGSSAVALLQVDEENAFLHLVHKGSTRGLTVSANDKGEMIFCSRPEPVEEELKERLAIGKFKEKVVINPKEEAGLKLSFPVVFE